jgi:hypothetical protein
VKGVASQDSPKSEIKTFKNAVFFNCSRGIFRTSGKKAAAVAKKRADRRLIEAQHE